MELAGVSPEVAVLVGKEMFTELIQCRLTESTSDMSLLELVLPAEERLERVSKNLEVRLVAGYGEASALVWPGTVTQVVPGPRWRLTIRGPELEWHRTRIALGLVNVGPRRAALSLLASAGIRGIVVAPTGPERRHCIVEMTTLRGAFAELARAWGLDTHILLALEDERGSLLWWGPRDQSPRALAGSAYQLEEGVSLTDWTTTNGRRGTFETVFLPHLRVGGIESVLREDGTTTKCFLARVIHELAPHASTSVEWERADG